MTWFSKKIIPAVLLGLTLSSSVYADDQRYISIRNTDTIWVPGNICVYQFRLDNGGSGEGFGELTLALRLKDKNGNTLTMGEMSVEPFGDSDATRMQEASLEGECVEDVSAVEIMKVTENSNGYSTNLPLSIFDTQYYQPLSVTIAGMK